MYAKIRVALGVCFSIYIENSRICRNYCFLFHR